MDNITAHREKALKHLRGCSPCSEYNFKLPADASFHLSDWWKFRTYSEYVVNVHIGSQSCEETNIFMHCSWECKLIPPYGGEFNHTYLPQMHLSTDPAISLLAIKPSLPIPLRTYKVVHCSSVLIAWKQPMSPSVKRWLNYRAVT